MADTQNPIETPIAPLVESPAKGTITVVYSKPFNGKRSEDFVADRYEARAADSETGVPGGLVLIKNGVNVDFRPEGSYTSVTVNE